jgi:hypothetical protein
MYACLNVQLRTVTQFKPRVRRLNLTSGFGVRFKLNRNPTSGVHETWSCVPTMVRDDSSLPPLPRATAMPADAKGTAGDAPEDANLVADGEVVVGANGSATAGMSSSKR